MVTVQIGISGNPSNTFPKILAVVSAILLSIGGGGYYFSEEKIIDTLGYWLVNIRYNINF